LRIQRNFNAARQLLSSADSDKAAQGLSIVRQLIKNSPPDLQEYYDLLCEFIRSKATRENPAPGIWEPALRAALTLLCSLPKYDRNQWPYNIELWNIMLCSSTLHGLNLENAVMFDCLFRKVDFSRTSFKNCDLGGTVFERSSVEWCNFAGSQMNVSFLSGTATSFLNTRLWGCNLQDANIAKCRIHKCDGWDLQMVDRKFPGLVEIVSLVGAPCGPGGPDI
jgi:hypothetical protein